MKRFAAFLWVLCTALTAVSGEPTVVIMADGSVWYSDGSGADAVRVENVVRIPGAPGPGPNPPPQPPPTGGEVSKLAKKLADEVNDPSGALIMSATYELIGANIDNGKIPPNANSVDKAITAAADKAIGMIPGDHEDDWEEVHKYLMEDLSKRIIQSGGNLTKAKYAAWFADASKGLEQSADGASVPSFLEPLIAVLIQVLIELLSDLFD